MQTYLINLDREHARLDWMTRQLRALGIEAERISGVDGQTLGDDAKVYHCDPLRSHLSTAEIGCLLSHIKTWNVFLRSEVTYALILEDDLHFGQDFREYLQALPQALDPNEICVHRLETFCARITVERTPKARIAKRSCHELHSNHGGAAAYVLNKPTAAFLLSLKDRMRHLPDTEMFDPGRRAADELTVYQWLPAPCLQDMLHEQPIGLKSALSGDRSDIRNRIFETPGAKMALLKDIFRPIYTFLYDLSLWPRGRSRKSARFQ